MSKNGWNTLCFFLRSTPDPNLKSSRLVSVSSTEIHASPSPQDFSSFLLLLLGLWLPLLPLLRACDEVLFSLFLSVFCCLHRRRFPTFGESERGGGGREEEKQKLFSLSLSGRRSFILTEMFSLSLLQKKNLLSLSAFVAGKKTKKMDSSLLGEEEGERSQETFFCVLESN